MKKLFVFIFLMSATLSCYDEYITDFDYCSVYFPKQRNVRTFVVGEDMKIEIGANLGGVRSNTKDRYVDFIIDNTLITPSLLTIMKLDAGYIKTAVDPVNELLPLPSNYYTLSNPNTMIIEKGQHMGSVVLRPDSALFLADASTIIPTYAISLRITGADADTVLASKDQTVIALKYENMLFGNYWHGGVTIVKNPGNIPVDTIEYYTAIPTIESKIWNLKTTAPNALVTYGFSNQTTQKAEMVLSLNGSNISISSAAGSTFTFMPDGESTFNRAKLLQDRKLFLNYKYINTEGNTCYATDTLTFRNRVRDGVNEWQDENPSNY